jgi:hypothetical protein
LDSLFKLQQEVEDATAAEVAALKMSLAEEQVKVATRTAINDILAAEVLALRTSLAEEKANVARQTSINDNLKDDLSRLVANVVLQT